MPTYTLKYFNLRALAEVSRLMFALTATPYNDVRYKDEPSTTGGGPIRPELIADKKSGLLPFGQVPILIVDDNIVIAQSKAIDRFVARRLGLMGADDITAAHIDAVGESIRDIRDAYYRSKDDEQKRNEFFSVTLVNHLKQIDGFAAQHGTDGHIVGGGFSLADIQLFDRLAWFDNQDAINAALANCPHLVAVRRTVGDHPNIKKWISQRPVTTD